MPDISNYVDAEQLATYRASMKDLIHEFRRYLVLCDNENTLPEPEYECRFHPTRRWRFDVAWEDAKVAVELDGGVYSGGRHTRGKGFENDCEKINAAQDSGWIVYRYTAGMMRNDPQAMIDQISEALERRTE